MTTPRAQSVSPGRPLIDAAGSGSAAPAGPFVINLCSSTTPVALSQPQDPELRRFSFFVSRRLEDGRERFRLHMGYFETLQEAEELLAVVREVYPGAWAGEAPGKRLRAQQELQPRAAGAPGARPAEAPKPPTLPAVAAGARGAAPSTAARAAARAPAKAPARPAPQAPPAHLRPPTVFPAKPVGQTSARTSSAASGVARSGTPADAKARALVQSVTGRSTAAGARAAAPASASKAPAPRSSAPKAAPANRKATSPGRLASLSLSNVREVLAALDETGATQQMPSFESRSARAPAPDRNLSDSQVLRLLEARRSDGGRVDDDSSIALLKPDDTGTRRELREAVVANAPVSFAVQLQWSVQPIEPAKLPPLAIFSAYTLYTVEGSREGRRWYGLRLGFFSDAIAAKQVAQYVRSEFASVAVVPVGQQERGRASATDRGEKAKTSIPASPVRDKLADETEFKLIDEPQQPPVPAVAANPAPQKGAAPASQKPRTPKSQGGRVRAREKRSPQTLEETLEILGADQLEMEPGRGERLNDSGVRHLKVEVRKDSPFTRLLDRLVERGRKTR